MSNSFEIQAALFLPPMDDGIAVIASSTSSTETDLSARTELTGYKYDAGRFITLIADANVWLNFGATASGTASKSAVTGATQTFLLPAGTPISWISSDAKRYMRHIADAATFIRIYVSSRMPEEIK